MLLLAARVASLRAGDQANPPGMQMYREDASDLRRQHEFHRGTRRFRPGRETPIDPSNFTFR